MRIGCICILAQPKDAMCGVEVECLLQCGLSHEQGLLRGRTWWGPTASGPSPPQCVQASACFMVWDVRGVGYAREAMRVVSWIVF